MESHRHLSKRWVFSLVLIFSLSFKSYSQNTVGIQTPEDYFGFQPGSDRMLFDYEELIGYLQQLDQVSPRLKLMETGKTPMGRTMYLAMISSEENIRNLEKLKAINRRLALDSEIPESERDVMMKEGKVFFLATLSMHSGEVGPSQSAPLIAYDFAATKDPKKLKWMEDVVYMMVPCHNPDGMDLVVNHYKKYKGTKYEGSSLPGLYHKYVGHDNNRDFITLTQSDNKAVARIYNLDWFPQVMVEKHQMGSTGPRFFVPPNHDPIAENIDAGIWNWNGIFGSNMIKDMTKEGLAGVSQHYLFDDYWPGSTETCIWKNVLGFLTEAASVKYATPIWVESNELRVGGKGLSEYKKSTNMPLPWPGGWWRLSDLMQYEIVSTLSIIKTASLHREDILRFRNDICRKEVRKGNTEPPFYYIMPLRQHDPGEMAGIVNLMKEHGVDVFQLSGSVTLDEKSFQKGDIVIPLAQPFRSFIKEVMEKQTYPVRHYTPDGEIIKPYDITTWSLPLHRGVQSIEIRSISPDLQGKLTKIESEFQLKKESPVSFRDALFSVNLNESYKAAFLAVKAGLKVRRLKTDLVLENVILPKGSFLVQNGSGMSQLLESVEVSPVFLEESPAFKTIPFSVPRIALVETYFHDMDAGWTRYIFDSYHIPFTRIRPGDFEKIDFVKDYDVVVFPDADKSVLMEGKYKSEDQYYISSYPPEYTKGIGKEGMARLMTFLENGGIIISWGRSAGLFMGTLEIPLGKDEKEDFQLPVNDISDKLGKDGLYCAGCLVRLELIKDHPITMGMLSEVGVFTRGRPVFTTSQPRFDMDRRVIGMFPENNIIISGYSEKEEKLGNRSGLVWLKKGKGQLVIFGFQPQFRASMHGTFKLVFNAMLLAKEL